MVAPCADPSQLQLHVVTKYANVLHLLAAQMQTHPALKALPALQPASLTPEMSSGFTQAMGSAA
jgi:hypothetical protein